MVWQDLMFTPLLYKFLLDLLQKDGKNVSQAKNILDPDYVIGVWASASRQQINTFNGDAVNTSGNWVQVSRLGMPLTNEAIIPVGMKDMWNTKYSNSPDEAAFEPYFENPELALYMDQQSVWSSRSCLIWFAHSNKIIRQI